MGGRLYVDFCGEEHVLGPPDELSFGREGDLVIDDNPYLHRELGRFAHRDGHWWLDNTGSSIVLNVFDRGSPSSAVLAPGRSLALAMAEFGCGFVAGPSRYEIDAALEEVGAPDAASGRHPDDDGTGLSTLEWGVVELNEDQRLLLVSLAAPRLRDPAAVGALLPSKRASAHSLGWSLSKYNRKLDHLCIKLDRAGVPGLYGSDGLHALDRRRRLVEHAVAHGLVTPADLEILEAPAQG